MNFASRVALVTGAAQGIGRDIALSLAEAGADVAIGDLQLDKLASVCNEIQTIGRRGLVLSLNVSDAANVKAGVEKTLEEFGKIDILVNNAGITRDNLAMRMKEEDWDAVLKVNLSGAFHCIKAVLPGMVKQRYGRIVSLASVVAQAGNAGQANYIASKAGLIGLTKAIAAEVASRNVTVNAVAPGFIDTAMTTGLPEEIRKRLLSMVPLGRMGSGREIASAVRFLASDEASYITGHVLNVNGGMFMQ